MSSIRIAQNAYFHSGRFVRFQHQSIASTPKDASDALALQRLIDSKRNTISADPTSMYAGFDRRQGARDIAHLTYKRPSEPQDIATGVIFNKDA